MNRSNASLKDTTSNVSNSSNPTTDNNKYIPPHRRNNPDASPAPVATVVLTPAASSTGNSSTPNQQGGGDRPPRQDYSNKPPRNRDNNNNSGGSSYQGNKPRREYNNNNQQQQQQTEGRNNGDSRPPYNKQDGQQSFKSNKPRRDYNNNYNNNNNQGATNEENVDQEQQSRFQQDSSSQPSEEQQPRYNNRDDNRNSSNNKFLSKGARQDSSQSQQPQQQQDQSQQPRSSQYNNNRANAMGGNASRPGRRHQFYDTSDPQKELELFGELRSGIDFTTYDSIPGTATSPDGVKVPNTITAFSEIAFGPHVESNLKLCGYERPTPIQKFSLPIAMASLDMIACAQTGSGKTAAFLLPVVYRLLNSDILTPVPGYRTVQSPQALILGPTRELVTQIYKEACKFTYRTTIKPVVVYGGIYIQDQIKQLNGGCNLLVATPGRLHDLCDRGNISLKHVQMLIFDEADCMLDMGFLPQIEALMNGFDMPTVGRQTLMFSATFPPEIQRLASAYLTKYVYVTIGRVGSSTSLVTQKLVQSPQSEQTKRETLLGLLNECDGLTLIFVETRRSADMLEGYLVDNDINAASIHGDRTQREREEALSFFKSGHCPVLVATDVAARGLSIPNVEYVINYDMPNNIDDYVHRIGRTGRCGATGTAASFIGERSKGIASDLLENMKEAKQHIPEFLQALVDSSFKSYGGSSSYTRGRPPTSSGYQKPTPRISNQDVRMTQPQPQSNVSTAPKMQKQTIPTKVVTTQQIQTQKQVTTQQPSQQMSAVDAQSDAWW